MAAKVEKNEAVLAEQPNFERFYVRVRALDRAGNEGPFSQPAQAVALPTSDLYSLPQPGPLLGGAVAGRVLLTAEKSPFSIMSDLTVDRGAVIYIEPGVTLRFAPDVSLQVTDGGLLAYGTAKKPIRFAAKAAGGGPGAWKGLVLQGGRQVLLRYVQIEGAQIGIHIADSAPTLHAARVAGSSQAGVVLDSGAKPDITCSVLERNGGQGGIVIQGEGLHHNTFVDNDPFQVQSYTPLQIDLSQNYWGNAVPRQDWFLGNVQWEPALAEEPKRCTLPPAN